MLQQLIHQQAPNRAINRAMHRNHVIRYHINPFLEERFNTACTDFYSPGPSYVVHDISGFDDTRFRRSNVKSVKICSNNCKIVKAGNILFFLHESC